MSRRTAAPAALLALMVALIPGPASASAAREVPNGFFGVVADGPLIDGLVPAAPEFQRMQASGVETIRVVFDWRYYLQ